MSGSVTPRDAERPGHGDWDGWMFQKEGVIQEEIQKRRIKILREQVVGVRRTGLKKESFSQIRFI